MDAHVCDEGYMHACVDACVNATKRLCVFLLMKCECVFAGIYICRVFVYVCAFFWGGMCVSICVCFAFMQTHNVRTSMPSDT